MSMWNWCGTCSDQDRLFVSDSPSQPLVSWPAYLSLVSNTSLAEATALSYKYHREVIYNASEMHCSIFASMHWSRSYSREEVSILQDKGSEDSRHIQGTDIQNLKQMAGPVLGIEDARGGCKRCKEKCVRTSTVVLRPQVVTLRSRDREVEERGGVEAETHKDISVWPRSDRSLRDLSARNSWGEAEEGLGVLTCQWKASQKSHPRQLEDRETTELREAIFRRAMPHAQNKTK